MALAVTMLPIIARSAEVRCAWCPAACARPDWRWGRRSGARAARRAADGAEPGLATALILGVARAVGETAPVLITSGASTFMNGTRSRTR